jgi:hypothetical protein
VIDPLPQFTAAILLAVVFASAAVGKLMELSTFAAVVENYRILPRLLAAPVAYVLPVVELAVALALLVPVTRPAAAGAAAILLGVFALAIGINVRRGRLTIDCGCFRSTHRQRISWWMVLRNLLLMALALTCLADATARVLGLADFALGAFGAAALFALYLSVGTVTQPPPRRYEENYHASLGNA